MKARSEAQRGCWPRGSGPGALAMRRQSATVLVVALLVGTVFPVLEGAPAQAALKGNFSATLIGTSWRANEAPLPANADQSAPACNAAAVLCLPLTAQLGSVSCATATNCAAVGVYPSGSNGEGEGLLDLLSGGTWEATGAPLAGATASSPLSQALQTVMCPTARNCVAVGGYLSGNSALVETLSGRTWKASKAPLPANAYNHYVGWASLSCATAGSCAAVGNYEATGTYPLACESSQGLLETLAKGTWKVTQAPLPASALGGCGKLAAVSCSGPGRCIAVGSDADHAGNSGLLVETLSGGTWRASHPPLPVGAQKSPYGSPVSTAQLRSVSCSTPANCIAVGSYAGAKDFSRPLAEDLSGGTWRPTEVPLPLNVARSSNFSGASLGSLSCSSASDCVAVGNYDDTEFYSKGLVERFSGGTWKAAGITSPANTPKHPDIVLGRVSCSSASRRCALIGVFKNTAGDFQAMLGTLFGTAWVAVGAPLPPGAPPAPAGTNISSALYSVSCAGATCIAVGSYTSAHDHSEGLLETMRQLGG